MTPTTGEIWWVDFGVKQPRRPAKRRPAVVVAPFESDEWDYQNFVMIPLTKRFREKPSEVRILPTSENGLQVQCWAQCELSTSMPSIMLLEKIGVVDPDTWQRIRWILRTFMGFD
jgi:mRNA-degrading endonuclease toxin of MazEF toxin-antitoxin module